VKIDPSQIIVEPAASKITPVSTRVEGAVALPAPPSAVAGLPVAESDELASAEEAAVAPAMAIGIDDPARSLMARGDALMAIGDVVSARSFYDRAFSIGNVRAAWSIARTYDPLVLAALRVQGLRANPAKALEWYRKAETGGAEVAQAIGAMEQLVKE
jgi:TPR repeat protein